MTTEEAIDYLEQYTDGIDSDFDDVISLAVDALHAQQERENPKPLTLEELREMDGEPVWMQCTYLPKCSGWEIAGEVDTDFGNRTLYCAGDVTFRNYGDAWLAYRHKPKKG